MAGNTNLNLAAKNKNDEFYTQLSDIEKELRHYRQHFEGKTVLCNCDDPFESNFFKYFALKFNDLKLKKLIATCYAGSPITGTQLSLFDEDPPGTPYKAVVTKVHDTTGDGGIDMFDVAELFRTKENELTKLKGDGDFRSQECLELLDEADIVCTNPPFSQILDYLHILIEHEKSFVIIGKQNMVKAKEIFPLILEGKLWLGNNRPAPKEFFVPEPNFEKKNVRRLDDGRYIASFGNILWFTNLDIPRIHEELILVKRYNPQHYPKYENFNAIEVGNIVDIPFDYDGLMGVPITFMSRWNPSQFEIVGYGLGNLGKSIGVGGIDPEHKAMMVGHSAAGDVYYLDGDGTPVVPYGRIIIRNKHPYKSED